MNSRTHELANFIDTHAHLTFPDYDKDHDKVIKNAFDAGLEYIINIGSGLGIEDNQKSLDLALKNERIYSTIGFHPHYAADIISKGDEPFSFLKELSKNKKVVAVGEIGLDYHYNQDTKESQLECFVKLLNLARETKLPVIIHDRDAHDDTIFTLESEMKGLAGGVMHCFSGDKEIARRILDLGLYISITGAVTFKKKAETLHNVVKYVPIERLLIETDCPFISPEPYRGKRNEPSHVVYVAKKVAELKGLSLEDVGRITSINAKRLFHLPGEVPEGKIAYPIRQSLYINITNRCTLACVFCPKRGKSFEVKGHNLKLTREPDVEDVLVAIGNPSGYKEVVFCGFGEPTMRLELLKEIATRLKKGDTKIRLDTDGLANLVHGRNAASELKGLIDEISVSLNAHNAKTYVKICPSKYGQAAFQAVCEFIKEAKKHIPSVIATAVTHPDVDINACRKLAEDELKVKFRERRYQEVG